MADYSHEVIAQFARLSKNAEMNQIIYKNFGGEMDTKIEDLVDAVKFDMGTKADIDSLAGKLSEVEFNRLPADKCTFSFSWTDSTENQGEERTYFISAEDIGGAVIYRPWFFASCERLWVALEHVLIIEESGICMIYDRQTKEFYHAPEIVTFDADKPDDVFELKDRLNVPPSICFCFMLNKAIEVFSCSNVTQVVHKPPKLINRKRLKKGKTPFYEYRTIQIGSKPTDAIVGESYAKQTGLRRLHFCRGHIRRYKSGKKTWVTGHHRGTASMGVIEHDYRVEE